MRYPVRYDAESLYALLPAFYRIRDAEQGGGVLKDLIGVIAEQLGHRNPAITAKVYAHVLPESQRAALASLEPRKRAVEQR